MKRRNFVKGLIASAAIITTPGLLMPVREIIKPRGFHLSPGVYVTETDVSWYIPAGFDRGIVRIEEIDGVNFMWPYTGKI